jgi:hypothetical protein
MSYLFCHLSTSPRYAHQNVPLRHCNKMAAIYVLFHQCAVIEYLIKENSLAADIVDQLCCIYGDILRGVSSVQHLM